MMVTPSGSGGWGEGDGVAEGLQLANVVALESVRVEVFVVASQIACHLPIP